MGIIFSEHCSKYSTPLSMSDPDFWVTISDASVNFTDNKEEPLENATKTISEQNSF